MWEMYGEYIILYCAIGVAHFLIRYGVTLRKVVKHNQSHFSSNQLKIRYNNLIFMQGIFWPVGIVLRIVEKISLIGV